MADSSANLQISTSAHYSIGLDIGTTAVKAVAFDEAQCRIGLCEQAYPRTSPQQDWQEQDPDIIVDACCQVLGDLVKEIGKPPQSIGISAAMHSLILLDEKQQRLSPSIIWADLRARQQAKELKGSPLGKEIYFKTGTPIHPMSPLCKLLWFKAEQPEIFTQINMILGIKGYLIFKLFGVHYIDYSLASATGLFDIHHQCWEEKAIGLCGIKVQQLPQPIPTTCPLPSLSESWQQKLGLAPTTQWIIGGSDGCLANLGAGELDTGEAVLTVGTSGALRINSPTPLYDSQERIFCYYLLPNQYVIGGATNNGGNVWAWFVDMFGEGKSHEYWFTQAASVSKGCDGLSFSPYLFGERAPLWDPDASATFSGLRHYHNKSHMARAILEGIAHNIALMLDALAELDSPIHTLIVSGGLMRSTVFQDILAQQTQTKIRVSTDEQASALGAALLAQGRY